MTTASDNSETQRLQALQQSRLRRPAIGTPSGFRTVSESYTLKPTAIKQSKHTSNSHVETTSVYTFSSVAGRLKDVFRGQVKDEQLVGFFPDAVDHDTKRRARGCQSKSRPTCLSKRRIASTSIGLSIEKKSRPARPVESNEANALGIIIVRDHKHKRDSSRSRSSIRVHQLSDVWQPTFRDQHFAMPHHPNGPIYFAPDCSMDSSKEFPAHQMVTRKNAEKLSSRGKVKHHFRSNSLQKLNKLKQSSICGQPLLDTNTREYEDDDPGCRSIVCVQNILVVTKRQRSNSTPEIDRDLKRFASYTRVLDSIGTSWLAQIDHLESEEPDFGIEKTEEHDSDNQHENPVDHDAIFLLDTDTDSETNGTHTKYTKDGSNPRTIAGSFEMPLPTRVIERTFSTVRQTGGHIREVIQRLQNANRRQNNVPNEMNLHGFLGDDSDQEIGNRSGAQVCGKVADLLQVESSTQIEDMLEQNPWMRGQYSGDEDESRVFGGEESDVEETDEGDDESSNGTMSTSGSSVWDHERGVEERGRTCSSSSNESFQYDESW